MTDWTDAVAEFEARSWQRRLNDLVNPEDWGVDSLPPVSQECADVAATLMELAERDGFDSRLSIGWEDDAVDVILKGTPIYASISIIVGYKDEWTDSNLHEPAFVYWKHVLDADYIRMAPKSTDSVEEALDWLKEEACNLDVR